MNEKYINFLNDLKKLINIAKDDISDDNFLKVRDEFLSVIKKSKLPLHRLDEINNVEIISKTGDLAYRCWLVKYKDRGFILFDKGLCGYEYLCTAEELILSLTSDDYKRNNIKEYFESKYSYMEG